MEIRESIRLAFKELIVPELDTLKQDNREIRAILDLTNKRLDDVNTHLADQSRRIDSLREELSKGINSVRTEFGQRLDSARDQVSNDIKETNKRLDRLYDVIVRREEHYLLAQRVADMEREVREIKQKLAA